MQLPVFAFFLIGLIFGSFFNALVWRFVRRKRSMTERHSVCVHCGHDLGVLDLVPVVSFLFLLGRCRYCRKPIPWHYPVVELVTGVLVALPAQLLGFSLQSCALSILALFLIPLFLLDLRYNILPDAITLPGLVVALGVGVVFGRSFGTLAIGGILGAGFFALQYAVSRGKWIGDGDIRLGGMMGLALGWQLTLVALALSYVAGALISVPLLLTQKKQWTSEIPFGIFLTVALYAVLLWGDRLLQWYLQTLGVA